MATERKVVKLERLDSSSNLGSDGYTFHPDYELKAASLGYNSAYYSCLQATGQSNFINPSSGSTARNHFVGEHAPDYTGEDPTSIFASATPVSEVIGRYASECITYGSDYVMRSLKLKVGRYVEGYKFYEYDRSLTSNNSSWGKVRSPEFGASYMSSVSWTYTYGLSTNFVPSDVIRSGDLRAYSNNANIHQLGYWHDGDWLIRYTTPTRGNTYSASDARDMTGVVAVFGLSFTVAFNANGGSGTMTSQSLYYGVSDYESQLLDTRNQFAAPPFHVFDGWNTAVDGSGTTVEAKANVGADNLFDDMGLSAGETVTLYAQWRLTGFSVTVTKTQANAAVGTLNLIRISDDSVVATENASTHMLSYTGGADGEYRVVLDMRGENEALYDLQGIASGNHIEPKSGDELTLEFVVLTKTLYPVVLPTQDINGNAISVSVTSPASPDGTVEVGGTNVSAYVAGRNVVVHVDAGTGRMPDEVYLDDLRDRNFATYTRESMDGDSFTILGISTGCKIRVKTAERKYDVAASAEEGHAVAFSEFSVTSGGETVTSVTEGTEVTFTATMRNSNYQFEGWYQNGEKVSGSASYTATVTGDMELKAKANAKVSIDKDGTSETVSVGFNYSESKPQPTPPEMEIRDLPFTEWVPLGYKVKVDLLSVPSGWFFWGWYGANDASHTHKLPYASQFESVLDEALLIKAWFQHIEPTGEVTVSVAYAQLSDESMGDVYIDGAKGAGAAVTKNIGSTASIVAVPKNGFRFIGWYANVEAQGDKLSGDQSFDYTMMQNVPLFAKFAKAERSLCKWEGGDEPKTMTWRSKTYEASKPFNPSACRVDARGYPPSSRLELTVDMFSASDAAATATAKLVNIASQNARRLPVRRMERYMQVEVVADCEVDAVLVGTSMGGLAQ